ncbi:S9 family peptidase [Paenibacillus sp. HJGM_3]|uniref:S9 family peptidase n=1 Tax=Paenibacillus sp. HJGM_3 TaxID=3379816 RepID=UPI0038589FDB
MIKDFHFNTSKNILVLHQEDEDRSPTLAIRFPGSNEISTVIDSQFVPQGPRISPNGKQFAFFGDARIFTYDIETKSTKILFNQPGDHAGFCEWSPDGKRLVFSAYGHIEGNRHPPNLYVVDISTGISNRLTFGDYADRFPQWSPCGRYIAFHRQKIDEPGMPGWVYIMDTLIGSEYPLPKQPDMSFRLSSYCFSKDSTHIVVTAACKGSSFLRIINLKDLLFTDLVEQEIDGGFFDGQHNLVIVQKRQVLLYSIITGVKTEPATLPAPIQLGLTGPIVTPNRDNGVFLFLGSDCSIYTYDPANSSSTVLLESKKKTIPYARREEYWISSLDGKKVPVLRVIPHQPKNKAILLVFGGPNGKVDPDFFLVDRFLQEGFEVIMPSYRGKQGYGEEHAKANVGELGRADVWDIVACGQDWKGRFGENQRLFLAGFSYGGFLTMLAMARNNVPWERGISLWALTRIEYLGAWLPIAYPNDPAEKEQAVLERNPILQAHHIKTPLLILHGGRDTTATNSDVNEIYRNVTMNGTKCKLIVFDDDTHALPKNRKQMFKQIFNFLK